jgi:aspartyl-tRNA(Asn)/glutamyl-tRNA(Gln) amidotransferase subunit C
VKVTEKDVAYVAELADLALTAQESADMVRDLNSILDYVDCLNELDTSGIAPMAQPTTGVTGGAASQAANSTPTSTTEAAALRDDVVNGLRESLPTDVALANAPGADGTFFRVPKVIER